MIEAADVFDGDNQLTHALRYAEAIANDRSIEDIEARSKRLAARNRCDKQRKPTCGASNQ